VSAASAALKTRRLRYYVLEVLGVDRVAADPDCEIRRFSVASSGFDDLVLAWRAAGDMRRQQPHRFDANITVSPGLNQATQLPVRDDEFHTGPLGVFDQMADWSACGFSPPASSPKRPPGGARTNLSDTGRARRPPNLFNTHQLKGPPPCSEVLA
jgi:hypothetical protein